MTRESWNQKLAGWMGNSRERSELLKRKIPRGTLHDYLHGRVTNLARMKKDRRAFLYHTTRIEDFCFDGHESYKDEEVKKDVTQRGRLEKKGDECFLAFVAEDFFHQGEGFFVDFFCLIFLHVFF